MGLLCCTYKLCERLIPRPQKRSHTGSTPQTVYMFNRWELNYQSSLPERILCLPLSSFNLWPYSPSSKFFVWPLLLVSSRERFVPLECRSVVINPIWEVWNSVLQHGSVENWYFDYHLMTNVGYCDYLVLETSVRTQIRHISCWQKMDIVTILPLVPWYSQYPFSIVAISSSICNFYHIRPLFSVWFGLRENQAKGDDEWKSRKRNRGIERREEGQQKLIQPTTAHWFHTHVW